MQVKTGMERSTAEQCGRVIERRVLRETFIPHYEEMKRYQGDWHIQKKILFPGYVFLVTDTLEDLYAELKKIMSTVKLLGAGPDIIPLQKEEVDFLCHFGGDDHVVKVSRGIIEGMRVHVLEGPLMGYEGQVRKIDRHKRKAWLEIPMFGNQIQAQVGLEIIRK